ALKEVRPELVEDGVDEIEREPPRFVASLARFGRLLARAERALQVAVVERLDKEDEGRRAHVELALAVRPLGAQRVEHLGGGPVLQDRADVNAPESAAVDVVPDVEHGCYRILARRACIVRRPPILMKSG